MTKQLQTAGQSLQAGETEMNSEDNLGWPKVVFNIASLSLFTVHFQLRAPNPSYSFCFHSGQLLTELLYAPYPLADCFRETAASSGHALLHSI